MSSNSLCFIGAGNMARSLIGGLVHSAGPATVIHASDPHPPSLDALRADFGVSTHADNVAAARSASVWILAVKPQVMATVCSALRPAVEAVAPLVISIAAGVQSAQMQRWLGPQARIVRAMPNTPALLGAGVTGLYATAAASSDDRDQAQRILAGVGECVWIDDEALMDVVTAVSGSGPAYFFLFAEALQAAGEAQGLPAEAARQLAARTALGAARMLLESGESAAELRRRVTSPGGTTQRALELFEAGGLRELVAEAVAGASERGRELSAALEG